MSRMIARLSAIAAATGGASAVEFALVAAFFLLPMTLGLYDFGTALYRWMEVGNAARAGAAYFNTNGFSQNVTTAGNPCNSNTSSFSCAVQGATKLGTLVTATTGSATCGCQSGTTYYPQSISPPCSTCPSGGTTPVTIGTVTAHYNYRPIFNYLGFGPANGFILSSQSTVLVY